MKILSKSCYDNYVGNVGMGWHVTLQMDISKKYVQNFGLKTVWKGPLWQSVLIDGEPQLTVACLTWTGLW